jgi:hypothetical protein
MKPVRQIGANEKAACKKTPRDPDGWWLGLTWIPLSGASQSR